MPGDQMVFVQVPQNTPESQLLMAQAAGKGKYKCSLCYRYFLRACVWALQIKQIKVVLPHLSYTEGGWNPFGEIFLPLQRQVDLLVTLLPSPVLSPQTPHVQPGPKSSTQDITVPYLNLSHSQMTEKKCD